MTKELDKKFKSILDVYDINTPLRLAHFFAQLDAESGLVPKRESGFYRNPQALREIFKTPFLGKSTNFVESYLMNSEKLLNYVYSNRMGNGDVASGDGFRYRGAGFIQTTGFNQFHRLSLATGNDYLENPKLLETEEHSMIAACYYWKINNLNKFADADNLDAISDLINIGRVTDRYGDANGFKHRQTALINFKKHFNI